MKYILIIFLCLPFLSNGQIITTVAGNGIGGYSGDSIAATTSEINQPSNIIIDIYGNLIIADGSNYRVRKVDSFGIITTFGGIGTVGYTGDHGLATNATFNSVGKVVVDRHNNLYVDDGNNQVIRKIDAITGIITTYAGNGLEGFLGDNGPATAARLDYPGHIAIDAIGNLYIADVLNKRVRKVDTFGIITTIAGNGFAGFTGDSGLATNAELSGTLKGLACDLAGNVYIADEANYRVRKVDVSTGIISTFAGSGSSSYLGYDIPATAAGIAPAGLAFDIHNNLFIADFGYHRIYKVNSAGILQLIAGTGLTLYNGDGEAATAANLYQPYDVAFDPCGNLYIADVQHERIRKVTFDSTCRIATLKTTNIAESKDIKLYPNPANHTLSISYSEAISSVVVYDMVGKIVIDNKYNSINSVDIDVRRLKRGVYVVRVNGGEMRRFVVSEP